MKSSNSNKFWLNSSSSYEPSWTNPSMKERISSRSSSWEVSSSNTSSSSEPYFYWIIVMKLRTDSRSSDNSSSAIKSNTYCTSSSLTESTVSVISSVSTGSTASAVSICLDFKLSMKSSTCNNSSLVSSSAIRLSKNPTTVFRSF